MEYGDYNQDLNQLGLDFCRTSCDVVSYYEKTNCWQMKE